MKNKKKTNIVLYTVSMMFIFLIITRLFIWGYGSELILDSIINYPFGYLVISEAVLLVLTLIVLLLFNNSYVFTQKKERITKGLFYGLFYLINSTLLILIMGFFAGGFKGGLAIINILIGCLLIGLTEEFLCRGWLLNEFLERFGDTKKGVWYSIVASGLVFGLLHLFNIFTGQDGFGTLMQSILAIGSGIFFGVIYYKTKNIWSVAILHGIWDFSLMLGKIGPVYSKQYLSTKSASIIIIGILLLIAVLINIVPYVKDINAEPKKGSIVKYSIISIFVIIFILVIYELMYLIFVDDLGPEYKYDNIEIKNYSVTYDNYEDYYIKDSNNNYSFKFEKNNDNELVFTNMNTKYTIKINCKSLVDYIIMEKEDYYIIAYIDFIDTQNTFLNYIYVMKDMISNDNAFMDRIKTGFKKYMLSDRSELLVINNRVNNKSYLGAYSNDYGYYLLVSEDKMAILNRG